MERRVREARLSAALRRRGPTREPYDRILSSANIEIAENDEGSNPINVVDCAIKRYRSDRGYDRVYCVFDRDRHARYREALAKISPASSFGSCSTSNSRHGSSMSSKAPHATR